MGGENFADLIAEVRETRNALATGDTARDRVLAELKRDFNALSLKSIDPAMRRRSPTTSSARAHSGFVSIATICVSRKTTAQPITILHPARSMRR
jgi:hypothetical protein